MSTFINAYVDYIYETDLLQIYRYRRALKKMGSTRKIKYITSIRTLNRLCDVVVGFNVSCNAGDELKAFRGEKLFHTADYYMHPRKTEAFYESVGATGLIGHCQLDERCAMFREYYGNYTGRVINLPFGYSKRFVCRKPFDERINKAVGLGSINPVRDPMAAHMEDTEEFAEFFKDQSFQHPVRYFLKCHKEEFSDCIDALFPDEKTQKDFSYDAVERLNAYKMFINDEGLSNFPPARTFEGIACGAVMVASDDPVYADIGLIPNVHYVAFKKGDYDDLIAKVRYYCSHPAELKAIQEQSLEISAQFTHAEMAKRLYEEILSMADHK